MVYILRDNVAEEFHLQSAGGCFANVNVHKDDWSAWIGSGHGGGYKLSSSRSVNVMVRGKTLTLPILHFRRPLEAHLQIRIKYILLLLPSLT